MPSDKSGGVVIINKQDYFGAAENMLADRNVYKMRNNPLNYMLTTFNKKLEAIVGTVD